MRLILEKRTHAAQYMYWASPLLAISLTMLCGFVLFGMSGHNPFSGVFVYFIEPLTNSWSLAALAVKAMPLILIALGLSVCFKANVWNIGAEGQLVVGAIFGSIVPIIFNQWQSPLTLLTILLLGAFGGALFASIPAFLKIRFNVNEILTSLMLVYVAQLLLDWIVRGPWRDPDGFNFPQTISFEGWQRLPTIGDNGLHVGVVVVLCLVVVFWLLVTKTRKGFEVSITGKAWKAAAFAGFNGQKMVMFCFLLSGACAGLAGVMEVVGSFGKLQPVISPGYGFTAIIVAFLGRLHPLGILFAAFILAISYIGGEGAQIVLGVSSKTAQVFQGLLLFFILAGDTFIYYRLKLIHIKAKD